MGSAPLSDGEAFCAWAAPALTSSTAAPPLGDPAGCHPLLFWLAQVRLSLLRAAREGVLLAAAPTAAAPAALPPPPQSKALARAFAELRATSPSGLLDAAALRNVLCPTVSPAIAAVVFSAAAGGAAYISSAEALARALAPLLDAGGDAEAVVAWAALRGGDAVAAMPPPPAPGQSSAEAAPGAAGAPPAASELRVTLRALKAALYINVGIPPKSQIEEADVLRSDLEFAPPLRKGDVWCLLPEKWHAAWASGAAPGAIPTSSLLQYSPAACAPGAHLPPLRDGFAVGAGVVPVKSRAWRGLSAWYGADGPPVPRIVATSEGGGLFLELYPLQISLLREAGRAAPPAPAPAPPPSSTFIVLPALRILPPAVTLELLGAGASALEALAPAASAAAAAEAAAAAAPRAQRLLLCSRNTTAEALRAALADAMCAAGGSLRLWRLARRAEVAAAAAAAGAAVPQLHNPASNPQWPFLPLAAPGGAGTHAVWAWPPTPANSGPDAPWESRWCEPTALPPSAGARHFRLAVEVKSALRGVWDAAKWHAPPAPAWLPPAAARYTPVGLSNPSTFCFVNAGLQCLLALPYFRYYFYSGAYVCMFSMSPLRAHPQKTNSKPKPYHPVNPNRRREKVCAAQRFVCRFYPGRGARRRRRCPPPPAHSPPAL